MNDVEVNALVDTTRGELRDRIAQALARFDRLARTADPLAPLPGSSWTAQQAVAHVLTIVQRYLSLRRGDSRLARQPHELTVINQSELEAVMAPNSRTGWPNPGSHAGIGRPVRHDRR